MSDDFSDDEIFVLILSLILASFSGWKYLLELNAASGLGNRRTSQAVLVLAPMGGLACLFVVLKFLADQEVRNSEFYILLFVLVGVVWFLWASKAFPFLGLSIREDVLEQRNVPAAVASGGAMLGILLTYAGGNIGAGPTIWTTFFSSLLATAGLFACWLLLEGMSRVSLAITEERDLASGWRLAGFLIAIGLILGRAVAGDWQSAGKTVSDFFQYGWPALVLTAAAILVEHRTQPTLQRPVPSLQLNGIFPANLYLSFALVVLLSFGKWK